MIKIVEFDDRPVMTGEKRVLVLEGDAPFKLETSCFVDKPPPPGFRPCAECGSFKIDAFERFEIGSFSRFWHRKSGILEITIYDSVGESLKLSLKMLEDIDTDTGSQMSSAQG